MLFSSATFLFAFLPLALLINLALDRFKRKTVSNIFLLAASLLFYAWGEPLFIVLMLFSMAFNWGMALLVTGGRHARVWLALSVAVNLGLLAVFKYLSFAIGVTNGVLGININDPGLPLPIGISFYTFQAMSYVIDARRGTIRPQKNPLSVMLYIAFFPQLVAGPIVQFSDIEGYIKQRRMSAEGMTAGITRFIAGLAKKLLIANTVSLIADAAFAQPAASLGIAAAWLGAIAYAVQIYFDFSGYSDMALGLGRMFGFTFRENFDHPYAADSMRGFWRRWHISLSSWFRDYVYIPLGGSRMGKARAALNRVIVFMLTGLWHGANWTFIVWGLMHGGLLLLETYGIIKLKGIWGRVYVALCAVLTFVMFRADTLEQGWAYIAAMFTGFTAEVAALSSISLEATPMTLITLALGIILSQDWMPLLKGRLSEGVYRTAALCLSVPLLLLCVLNLAGSGHNPFIYFRF